jgi:hypothetical protein
MSKSLQQYAIERFLYRISKSKHAQSVVLKRALLLKTIGIPRARPTMDIDMLRRGKADLDVLESPRLRRRHAAQRNQRNLQESGDACARRGVRSVDGNLR